MKRITITVVIVSALMQLVAPSARAWVKNSTDSCNSGVPGIACEKRMTRTNLKNDGSGEWLHSNDSFYFLNTSGPRSCTFTVDKGRTTLNNARISYSRTSSNRGFGWEGLLQIEQTSEGAWSYHLVWATECRK